MKSLIAGAEGAVVDRFAPGVLSARIITRIRALVLNTGQIHRAVRVQDTLRPAGRRGANKSGQTGADAPVTLHLPLAVGAANAASAWFLFSGFNCGCGVIKIVKFRTS